MGKLLFAILRFLFSNLGMLITIVVVLLVGTWAQREWQALANAQSALARKMPKSKPTAAIASMK